MDKKTTIKERVLSYLEMEGIKKADFFRDSDIQSSNFKGKNLQSQIGGDMIVKILTRYRNLSPSWLILGEGEMIISPKEIQFDTHKAVNSEIEDIHDSVTAGNDTTIEKLLTELSEQRKIFERIINQQDSIIQKLLADKDK